MRPIFTVGHSTTPIAKFIEGLKRNGIDLLLDVRTIAGSSHNPQFNARSLERSLAAQGVNYLHLPILGGLRKPRADSVNGAWRNSSFRGYADYMQTDDFEKGLQTVLRFSARRTVVLMCAEVLPWRCHRSLIADALVARGCQVLHVIGSAMPRAHELRSWASVDAKKVVTYPAKPKAA